MIILLKKNIHQLLVLLAVGSIVGCSLMSPSDAEVIQALTANDTLNGRLYQIQNFHRINGYETRTGYVVQFSCEIYIIDDFQQYFNSLSKSGTDPMGTIAAFGLAAEGIAKWGLLNVALFSASKKGDVVPFSGTIAMIKSEHGWIPDPSEE
jgi:hypothetical protein